MSFFEWCRRHWFSLGLGLVFLLPWLAFSRALFQDFAAIDDGFLIINNPTVHGLDWAHVKIAFTTFDPELYIPLTLLSFQFDWFLGGGSPVTFHITNLLLHGVNAVLVGLFIGFLLKGKDGGKVGALAAAALFAVHPLHTEAVVWAAGRKDLLCSLFFLLSAIFYLQSENDDASSSKQRRYFPYVLSLFAFTVGLLAKVLIATLPVVLLLLCIVRRKESMKRSVGKLIPFILLSAVFLYIAMWGKEQILASSTLLETAAMAQKSSLFYLEKLLLPVGLTVIYPFQGIITFFAPTFFVPLLINLLLLTLCIWQWQKRPLLSFGILFYYVTLVPTFFNFHKGFLLFFAVDRYAYIPSIGFLIVLTLIVLEIQKHLQRPTYLFSGIFSSVLAVLIVVSMYQTEVWNSPDTLFMRSITLYPESVSARMALGSILRERNQLEEAFQILHDGTKFSDHPGLNVEAGLVYSAAGQAEDARKQFEMALEKSPDLAPPMFYLGFLQEHDNNDASAIEWYRKALENDPSYVTVRVHLARLLSKLGKYDEAYSELMKGYAWNPVSEEVILSLIDTETARGNTEEAERWATWKENL